MGEDADGDFGRGDGADVEAYGGLDALQGLAGDAGGFQVFEDREDFSARADEANVLRRGVDDGGEGAAVVAVASGDDDDVGAVIDAAVGQGLVDGAGEAARAGEARGGGEVGAVVDDGNVEVGDAGDGGQGGADVACAGDDQGGGGFEGASEMGGLVLPVKRGEGDMGGVAGGEVFAGAAEGIGVLGARDELNGDVHVAAADQAVVPAEVVVELEGEEVSGGIGGGRCAQEEFERAGTHFCFDATAADGAVGLSVRKDEHDGAGLLRGAAEGADEGADGEELAGLGARDDLL